MSDHFLSYNEGAARNYGNLYIVIKVYIVVVPVVDAEPCVLLYY